MNGFKILKYSSFFVAGFMSLAFCLAAFVMVNDLMVAAFSGMFGLVLGVLLGDAILKHDLLDVLEGKGNLAIDVTSTGILQFYCARVKLPWIEVVLKDGTVLKRIYDRTIAFYMKDKVIPTDIKRVEGETWIKIPSDSYLQANFSLEGRPTFLLNSKLKTFMTKEFLGTTETKILVEHLVLNLLKTIEELNQNIKDFGRYVMEQIRPNRGIDLNSPWIKVIGFIIVGIIILYFGWPYLAKFLGIGAGQVAAAVPTGAINHIVDVNNTLGGFK